MAKLSVVLDTRKTSRKKDGTYPISLSIFHKKSRILRLGYSTTIFGCDEVNYKLKKSVSCNKGKRCDEIDQEIDDKFYQAKSLIRQLGKSISILDINTLVELIKDNWDTNLISDIKKKAENSISLTEWVKF